MITNAFRLQPQETPGGIEDVIIFIIMWFIFVAIYLLPTIVSVIRKHRNMTAIFILNVLLGWTFFGWVVALIWSVFKEKPKD
jgi:hypothetical protein